MPCERVSPISPGLEGASKQHASPLNVPRHPWRRHEGRFWFLTSARVAAAGPLRSKAWEIIPATPAASQTGALGPSELLFVGRLLYSRPWRY